jgi:predicted small lipoprotein YifL
VTFLKFRYEGKFLNLINMKNTLKTMLAVMSLTVALSACGSKPAAETTETKDSVVVADSTPVAADTTVVDSAAVAK